MTVAKAYRLLRAILATAVDDELIPRNPCLVEGAGIERSPEHPVATVEQVYRLADVVPPRFRALVLLAAFTGLRWGELAALARGHLDLDADPATVRVERTLVEPDHGPAHFGPPKTAAGRRTVAIPAAVVPELRRHLDTYAAPGRDGLVFCGAKGAMLSRRNFHTQIRWKDATRRAGLAGLHFHDLRHIANTLAAATGASTRELMARMGHASTRAALLYQHATGDRDAIIARAVDELLTAARRTTP